MTVGRTCCQDAGQPMDKIRNLLELLKKHARKKQQKPCFTCDAPTTQNKQKIKTMKKQNQAIINLNGSGIVQETRHDFKYT